MILGLLLWLDPARTWMFLRVPIPPQNNVIPSVPFLCFFAFALLYAYRSPAFTKGALLLAKKSIMEPKTEYIQWFTRHRCESLGVRIAASHRLHPRRRMASPYSTLMLWSHMRNRAVRSHTSSRIPRGNKQEFAYTYYCTDCML